MKLIFFLLEDWWIIFFPRSLYYAIIYSWELLKRHFFLCWLSLIFSLFPLIFSHHYLFENRLPVPFTRTSCLSSRSYLLILCFQLITNPFRLVFSKSSLMKVVQLLVLLEFALSLFSFLMSIAKLSFIVNINLYYPTLNYKCPIPKYLSSHHSCMSFVGDLYTNVLQKSRYLL